MFLQLFSSAMISVSFFKTRLRTLLETQGMHKTLPLKVKGTFEIVPYIYKTSSLLCIVLEIKIYLFSGVDLFIALRSRIYLVRKYFGALRGKKDNKNKILHNSHFISYIL